MMRNLFSISRILLLFPYIYTIETRATSLRDNLANAATSWIPGVLLLVLNTDMGLVVGTVSYVLGYAAFICLYEIGYLANDTIGLRQNSEARDRLRRTVDRRFVITFVLVRLTIFVAIVIATRLVGEPAYLIACLALVAVIVAHNALASAALKFTTFVQMSMLRFFLPVYAALLIVGSERAAPVVLATGVFCFAFPRLLTYQDSKDRLTIPERERPEFHLQSILLMLPALATIATVSENLSPIAVWGWLCFVGVVLLVRKRLFRNSSLPEKRPVPRPATDYPQARDG